MDECKTKLVATLGPSSSDYETIKELVLAGLDLARINMSHGTYEEHAAKIKIIERLADFSGRRFDDILDEIKLIKGLTSPISMDEDSE